jgi:prevent-host-death family protein
MTVHVGVREFRSRLSHWLNRAANGEEIVVTERGRPRVVVSAVEAEDHRQRLIEAGILTPAKKPWKPIDVSELPEIPGLSLTEILMEQRRSSPY